MLNINPEIVCFIITKAREFLAQEDVSLPEEPISPGADWALQALSDYVDSLCFEEIEATVKDLEPDQEAELVALMWLGRGDYELDEWSIAVEEAEAELTDHTAQYILAHPMVADHLLEGLIQQGYACDD
jgi:hypothetical protein